MNASEIAQRRMHNQRLWGTRFEAPEDVVQWLGALQAQEFAFAKWSVAQRTVDVTEAAMNRAFGDGSILRTHLLRPTWHFVLPADIRWLLDLTAPRVNALNAYYYRKFELDDELFARSNALLARALQGGLHLTRKELAAVLDRAGITADGLRLGYIMMRAELDAIVCSGGLKGKQHTYALIDERVPGTKSLNRDAALAELTKRYFAARGPATLKDYAAWSSLTAADCKSGLDMVKSQFEHQVVNGRTYWFDASSPKPTAASERIDLVQGYDECVMSYSESKDVLWASATMAIPQEMPPFTHAILLDGRLIGHWRPVLERHSIAIETSLYRPLAHEEGHALEAAVERYGRFREVPATLVPNR